MMNSQLMLLCADATLYEIIKLMEKQMAECMAYRGASVRCPGNSSFAMEREGRGLSSGCIRLSPYTNRQRWWLSYANQGFFFCGSLSGCGQELAVTYSVKARQPDSGWAQNSKQVSGDDWLWQLEMKWLWWRENRLDIRLSWRPWKSRRHQQYGKFAFSECIVYVDWRRRAMHIHYSDKFSG